jgi:hypothetical protein
VNLASAHSSASPLATVGHLDVSAAARSGLLHAYTGDSRAAARGAHRRRPLFDIFPLSFLCTTSLLAETPSWGFFSGRPKMAFFNERRRLRLLEDFSYTDPHGRTWLAPAAAVVDALSVARAFWSLVGEPFAEPFLRASIIHDVACEQRNTSWPEAHLAFYHALRCGGTTDTAAKILYYAAYHFGPRWGVAAACAEVLSALGLGHENLRQAVVRQNAADITAWIKESSPTLEELRTTRPSTLNVRTHPILAHDRN